MPLCTQRCFRLDKASSSLVLTCFLFGVLASTGCNLNSFPSPSNSTTSTGDNHSSARVSLTPDSATVASGGTLQLTALVQYTSNTAVTWSTTGGTISAQGLFQAPQVTKTAKLVVTATTIATPTSSANVQVTVVPVQDLKIATLSLASATTGASYSSTLSATGGSAPYQWTLGSGALPAGLSLSASTGVISGTPNQAGTSDFTVSVKDSVGNLTTQAYALVVASNVVGNFDGPAELPRVYLQSSLADTPAPGKTIAVNAGDDLQSAIDGAKCGDTISLQAGASFPGVFSFPKKSCDDKHWIVIRTSAPDSSLPPEGTRLTPCYAGVPKLPGRPPFHCSSTKKVTAQLIYTNNTGSGPVVFESGANHFRFIGLEVTRSVGTSLVSELISPALNSPADHIVLDRMWIHGTAQDETTRGVYLAGVTSASIIDSFFTDFHCVALTGTCTDSQAIGGGGRDFAAGPYKIVNNFLEAAGENILFGGGEATTSPTDIEIRQNHLFKPLIWMTGQPGFVGGIDGHPFIVKNNFELKNGQRVLFEGNIVEYNWGGFTQFGYSLVLTPKNQAASDGSNLCPSCRVTDVTIRYSTVSHAAAGINIANSISDNGGLAAAGGRYSIHDITLDDINGDKYLGEGPLVLVMNGWPKNILGDIRVDHITGFGDPIHPVLTVGNDISNPKMANFTFTNSIVNAGAYPVWSSGGKTNCAFSVIPITVIKTCFQPYAFTHSAFIAVPKAYPPSDWPAGNYFPTDASSVQFVNYNNADGGDYHLLDSSVYKNAATDGKDLGADIDAILAHTATAY